MRISIYLALGLVVSSAFLGIGFGYFITPEYRFAMYEDSSMTLGSADRTFDLRYIDAMIAHHRGAMLLAEQLGTHTTRPEMKTLASTILQDEPRAIAELYAWKKAWYGDVSIVRDPANIHLGSADETFDLRFLNAMIAHHRTGIVMTREARQKTTRNDILDNVDAVEDFLTNGINTLSALRTQWYAI